MAFNASETAAALREAMAGLGTDDNSLINKICALSNDQIQQVRAAYSADLQRDLIEDIKSETSGDYERILTGLILTPAEFDAKQLNKSIKGVGTDEEVFVQTLCHRTTDEVEAIKNAYLKMFGRTLPDDIVGDFSGDCQKVVLGLVTHNRSNPKAVDQVAVDEWAEKLYNAGEGRMGTDEETFVEAICTSGPAWLRAINESYGRKHSHTLVGAVGQEFKGFAAKALEAMLQDHDDYYAQLVHKAVEGPGTDEEVLTRVLVGRRQVLREINNKYMYLYKVHIPYSDGSDFDKVVKAIVEAA